MLNLYKNHKKQKGEDYPVAFEIAGKHAMFSDPNSSPVPVSLPVPPPSACSAIAKCFVRQPGIEIITESVSICSDNIVYQPYVFNYGGFLREKFDNSAQRHFVIIKDVRYIITVIPTYFNYNGDEKPVKNINYAHAYQERLIRQLKNGKKIRPICLGRKGFVPSYIGPVREDTKVNKDINLDISVFPFLEWDEDRKLIKNFVSLKIEEGVADYVAVCRRLS